MRNHQSTSFGTGDSYMTADTFLLAFQRFLSRRNNCEVMNDDKIYAKTFPKCKKLVKYLAPLHSSNSDHQRKNCLEKYHPSRDPPGGEGFRNVWCSVKVKRGGGLELRYRPRHWTMVQTDEARRQ
ncbi:hypothetical protein TNCV_4450911 [Trichonephila clavipes]|nr:hypothetical protein TNCV_4450911 [Trichonephila clavipes]